MLKDLLNKLQGMEKFKSETLNLRGLNYLLESFNQEVNGKINHTLNSPEFQNGKKNIEEIKDFIEENYFQVEGYHTKILHEIYKGKSKEKHYLTLTHGKEKQEPFMRTKISISVYKK